MQTRRRNIFSTIRTEGSILPSDLLQRIADGDADLEGLTPEAYHLARGEKPTEAVNRSWNRLRALWTVFKSERAKLRENEAATGLTRERWLLPLISELGYGRLQPSKALELGGKSYPISHFWHQVPIHLVGAGVDLDRRTAGVAGAARSSPHSLVQELLNRSDLHLWGFLSNGLLLRILRDNSSLTRQAYVEFDLKGMMDGEVYSDFVLLWLLCHQSRVEAVQPEEFWLEKWSQAASERGTRALDQLRNGVEDAIRALGGGFLSHKSNRLLRDRLQSGKLDAQDYYRQILRLVYRLLFLFVAEDRGLLLDPQAEPPAKERYLRYYSTLRLRRLAERRRGTQHDDLLRGLRLVTEKLGQDSGCPELALPALGSFLWSARATPDLAACEIANHDLLDGIRALALTTDENTRRAVDYRNLGSEELGSVYESLLELRPEMDIAAGTFKLITAGGNERKTTGSYYTPASLISCLLDSALDPVLNEAADKPNPEEAIEAILDLKVCDPACGSGHFLIAAAHRIARRLASVRTGDEEPSPEATRTALRDVIGRCIYGVDINEMAVELCKVSLWMEALEPGKPLSFLDHRIQCGNSLLGTTPALLEKGIPDEAFEPIEGDDNAIARSLKKQNRDERGRQTTMFVRFAADPGVTYRHVLYEIGELDSVDDASIEGVHEKEEQYNRLTGSSQYRLLNRMADAWCAAFVWWKKPGAPPAVTQGVFESLRTSPERVPADTQSEVDRLAGQYRWMHWHLRFPDVFEIPDAGASAQSALGGWNEGFDVVLGNPPWERIKLQEKEWFALRRPDIANAANAAARRRMINSLATDDPVLYKSFLDAIRQADGESQFVRSSGRFPLCGRGDINTYTIFAETNRLVLGSAGRVGCIVPSGIATDDTTKFFFQELMDSRSLVSLYDFENRHAIFPGVHRSYKFCLLTLSGSSRPVKEGAEFVFFAHSVADLREEDRRFTLSAEDLALLNPNTRTCPIFRGKRDAELTKSIYRRVPVLVREGPPEENPWGVTFLRMLDMANDSNAFRTRQQLEADGWTLDGNIFRNGADAYLPLYEAKMIHHFDHRWATYEGTETRDVTPSEKADPNFIVLPRYWVPEGEVDDRLRGKWSHPWLLGWRDITNTTNERTVIASVLPKYGCGDTVLLMFPSVDLALDSALIPACLDSYALDYVARQKVGGTHLKYHVFKQLPVLAPSAYSGPAPWNAGETIRSWMSCRVLELVYSARDLRPCANELGHAGPPLSWNEHRRFPLRCELDAAIFHLYGLTRDEVDYIMGTFPIVKRKDEEQFCEYRTKRVILETYDAMQRAIETRTPYQTLLDPPPADPRLAHPPRATDLAIDRTEMA